jgi:hypothetical protein
MCDALGALVRLCFGLSLLQDVVLHNLVSAAKGSVLRRLGDWVARLDNASHVLVCV